MKEGDTLGGREGDRREKREVNLECDVLCLHSKDRVGARKSSLSQTGCIIRASLLLVLKLLRQPQENVFPALYLVT